MEGRFTFTNIIYRIKNLTHNIQGYELLLTQSHPVILVLKDRLVGEEYHLDEERIIHGTTKQGCGHTANYTPPGVFPTKLNMLYV